MNTSNNTILITGGAGGIGLALTRLLHQRGNRLIVCGRNSQKLEDIRSLWPDIDIRRCDLSDETSLEALVEGILADHPDINVLINNAGIQYNYLFTDGARHTAWIREEVATNLLAPLQMTDRLLPHLMEQRRAAIVNVTSALALAPKKNAAVYCATKAAMRSFSRSLRYQLEGSRVSVFDLVPALVDTDMTRGRGRDKISPELVANELLMAMAQDRQDVLVGKTKMLHRIHRLSPTVANRLLKNT